MKSKVYLLSSGLEPVAYQIKSKHQPTRPLLYNDPETQTVRELRYATNMATPFVDEQNEKGNVTIGHVWFREGALNVRENDFALIKFLEIHPDNEANGGNVFYEHNPDAVAKEEIENLETSAEAMSVAKDLDIDDASAIVFRNVGKSISKYSSTEIKRDLLTLALNNPSWLLNAIEDESLKLDWTAYQALQYDVVTKKGNQLKLGKSSKSILTVKPGMETFEALSEFFLTDDGLAVLEEVKARLKKLLK